MREPLVAHWARTSPDAPALIAGSETTSWAALDARSRQMARRLRALGIGSGDRVAVVSENAPDLVELLHAAPRLGACVALLHARRTVDELIE